MANVAEDPTMNDAYWRTLMQVKTAVNKELEPMLQEARVTLGEANRQLKRIDSITEDVEQVTENINSLVAVFTASVGAPLTKLFGVTKGLFSVIGKRR